MLGHIAEFHSHTQDQPFNALIDQPSTVNINRSLETARQIRHFDRVDHEEDSPIATTTKSQVSDI